SFRSTLLPFTDAEELIGEQTAKFFDARQTAREKAKEIQEATEKGQSSAKKRKRTESTEPLVSTWATFKAARFFDPYHIKVFGFTEEWKMQLKKNIPFAPAPNTPEWKKLIKECVAVQRWIKSSL